MEVVVINGEDYILKQMSRDTVEDFTSLFNLTKKQKVSSKFFLDKYSQLPGFEFYYGFLLYKENIPVAHSGALPVNAVYNGNIYKIGQWTDTVTHPDFQKKGLNKFITNYTLEYCRSRGVEFIFRFSNPLSTAIARDKYGWHQMGNLERVTIPVKSVPVFKLLTKFGFHKLYNFYFSFVCSFFSFEQRGDAPVDAADFYQVHRSPAFFEYKKRSDVKLISFDNKSSFCLIKVEDGLSVGDFYPKQTASIENLLKGWKRLCFFAGLHNIKIVLSDAHPFIGYLKSKGSVSISNPIMIKDLSGNKLYEKFIFTGADRNTF